MLSVTLGCPWTHRKGPVSLSRALLVQSAKVSPMIIPWKVPEQYAAIICNMQYNMQQLETGWLCWVLSLPGAERVADSGWRKWSLSGLCGDPTVLGRRTIAQTLLPWALDTGLQRAYGASPSAPGGILGNPIPGRPWRRCCSFPSCCFGVSLASGIRGCQKKEVL